MFSLIIHGENSASELYLWELTIQCDIAELAFKRLQEYSRIQLSKEYSSTTPHPKNPIEVLYDCSTFLSAAGIIAKILSAKKGLPADRSNALRSILGIDELKNLCNLAVRNSFEHIDERLDRLLKESPSERFISTHMSSKEPGTGMILKHFNPNKLTLSYLGEELDLEGCHSEITDIQKKTPNLL